MPLLALALLIGCGEGAPSRSSMERKLVVGGEGAQYVYDGAGNILQVGPASGLAVAIAGFSPSTGGVGEIVSVLGAGFSPTPALNSVDLNGTPAAVLSATGTEITFAVPAGATTGRISVTTGGSTAFSSTDFTVVNGVVVSDFSPRIGHVGTVLTITGFNFEPNPAGDSVAIGGGTGSVVSADIAYLTAAVGADATSGKVSVTTLTGTGTSEADFFLLPTQYSEWDIGFTGRASGGAATAVTISEPGKAGLVLFDGAQGQFLSLFLSNRTLSGTTRVTVNGPGGTVFFATQGISGAQDHKFALPALPSSGTYTIAIQPAPSATGSIEVQVLADAVIPLPAGTATSMELAHGQNGRYVFTGGAGDSLGLACTSIATTPVNGSVTLWVYKADGTPFWGGFVSAATSFQLPQLTVAGTYTITVQPSGTAAASMTFLLSQPSTGVIVIDGPSVQFQNSSPGQAGRFIFAANAGDLLGLGAPALATTPPGGSATFRITKPDGNAWWSWFASYPASRQLPQIPVGGTYTLFVEPSGTATASTTFLLSRPIQGTLTTDGNATVYSSTRAGQSARYAFAGNAGERFTLQASSSATYSQGVAVLVYRPDGATLASVQLYASYDRKLDLGALPASGEYTVVLTPTGVSVGEVTLRLVRVAADTLVVGDPPQTLTLGPAQNGRYSFTGNAGERLGLAVTAISTTPANGYMNFTLYRPDGASVWNGSAYTPTSWQLPQLPTTGNYTLAAVPAGTGSASFTLALSTPLTGTLIADGPSATYQTTRPGQSGRYTFDGTAGQRLTMQATAGTFTGAVWVTVYQPSGAQVAAATLSAGKDVKLDLGALPASGIYTAVLTPEGLTTGQVNVRLVSGASDTLVTGDPPKTLTLGPAQNGRYTFTGNAGERLALAMTALGTTPANGWLTFNVHRPDGTSLWSGNSQTPRSWQLPALPATGVYALSVAPQGNTPASFTLLLSQPLTGTLAADGPSVTYQTTRPGQSGRYTFDGTAGQRLTMQATAGTFTGSISVTVYQPNGINLVASAGLNSGSDIKLDLGALPVAGSYTAVVVPGGVATGSVTLRLVSEATDTLTIGDSPKVFALGPAQNGRYAFAGTAGDLLSLAVPAIGTTPANGYVYVYLYRPNGVLLWNGGTSWPTSWQLPQLPATGTYALTVVPPGTSSASMTVQLTRR